MKVEKRIVLTKKEMEALKIVSEMYDNDDLFEYADDFMDFVNDAVNYDAFRDFIIVEED